MDEPLSPETFELPDSLAARVKPELRPGEKLLWTVDVAGRRPSEDWSIPRRLGCGSLFLIPGAVLLAMAYRGSGTPGSDISAPVTFGVVFSSIGLVIAGFAWKYWADTRAPFRPVFALTDRRAILWTARVDYRVRPGAVEVRSVERGSIRSVRRVEYPNSTGDVLLDLSDPGHGRFHPEVAFAGIADVRRVEDLARRVLIAPPTDRPEVEA